MQTLQSLKDTPDFTGLFGCPIPERIVSIKKVIDPRASERFEFKGSKVLPEPERLNISAISINPFYITSFSYPENRILSHSQKTISRANLDNNEKKVNVSEKSRKKMLKVVSMFIYSARKKMLSKKGTICDTSLKLVTLTLSGKQKKSHSDVFIKRNLLDAFIDWLRIERGCNHYIWKAERQGNGNIHFHLLINKYINYKILQDKWNFIQAKYGYLNSFLNRFGHTDPHSTEIRNGKKTKSLARYISKYFSKNETGKLIEGRTWYCSKSLQGLGNLVLNIIDHKIGRAHV